MGAVTALACSAGILWWGWSTNRLSLSVGMAISLLLAALWNPRWRASEKSRLRATELSIFLIAISAGWTYLNRQDVQGNLAIHALLLFPALLFPRLLFGVLFSESRGESGMARLDGAWAVRDWVARLTGPRRFLDDPFRFDFPWAYLLFCVFGAAARSPERVALAGSVFFLLFGIARFGFLARLAPASERRPFFRLAPFAFLAAFSLIPMWAGGFAIQSAQSAVEERMSRFFDRMSRGYNPGIAKTSIGGEGRMDLPDQLLYRIDWPESTGYLIDGAYARPSPDGSFWSDGPSGQNRSAWTDLGLLRGGALPPSFRRLLPNDDGSFTLRPGADAPGALPARATISTVLSRDRQAIALPPGSGSLFGLPLPILDFSRQNAASAQGTPGFVKFTALYDPAFINLPPPDGADLSVPSRLIPSLDAFIAAHGLRGLSPKEAAARIEQVFSSWEYTLELETPDGEPRSIPDFLFSDRRGHCEYFASASSLLLRRLNIPSRYVTGFHVSHRDSFEEVFWVRSSDAHAWSSYWDGSGWVFLDSTPAGWPSESRTPVISWIGDWIDRLQYSIDTMEQGAFLPSMPSSRALLPIFSFLLFALLSYALWRRLRRGSRSPDPASLCQELIFAVEGLTGLRRAPSESSPAFLRRAAEGSPLSSALLRAASEREASLFHPAPAGRAASEAIFEALILVRAAASQSRSAFPWRKRPDPGAR